MIIDRLHLKNYKRFQDEEIVFPTGITGIVGNNGTGKSSIVDAIFFALFGVADKSVPSDFIVSSFAEGQKCEVDIFFAVGSGKYHISRTFKKGKTVQHDAELCGECDAVVLATGVSQVESEVRKILGMGPIDFRNTIYAAQKDLMTLLDLTPGKRKEWFLRALGIDYLNRGSQEILKAKADGLEKEAGLLEGELAALSRADPSELDVTRVTLAELQQRIATLKINEKQQQEERTSVFTALQEHNLKTVQQGKLVDQEHTLHNDMQALTLRVDNLTGQMESLQVDEQDLLQLEKTLDEIPRAREDIESYRTRKTNLNMLMTEQAAAVREQENIQARIAKIDTHLNACYAAVTELEDLRVKVCVALGMDADKQVDEAVSEYRDYISDKTARLNARALTIESEITRLRTNLNTLVESGSDGTCPICLQKLGDHFDNVKNDYLDHIGKLGIESDEIGNELNAARTDSQRIPALKPTLDRIRDIHILLGSRENHEDEKAKLTRELLDSAKKITAFIETIEALGYNEEDHLACKQHLEDLEKAQNRYTDLTKRSAQQAGVKAQIAELNSQVTLKNASLAEVKTQIDANPVDLSAGPRLDHEVQKLDLVLKNIGQDLATSTERERTLIQKIADLELAAARIGTVQQQLVALRDEIEILKLTRTAIAEYVVYVMLVVRTRIETEVSGIIAEITGGKYDRVILDEDFNLLVRENDREYTVDRFSGGEQDDIAVALRIALSRYLAELHQVHESTLLIFDEIFGSQDEERRANLLTALRSQESRFPQILLISHISEIQGEFQNTLLVQGNGPVSTVKAVA